MQDCDTFSEFIDHSSDISLITSAIKGALCEFDGSHIFVCCPPKNYHKRHAKNKAKLDYLDELTGLNCPPSFGKEYNYDDYLKEHPDDEDDFSNSKKEMQGGGGRKDTRLCDKWGNCGRFKFPKDDGSDYYKPPPIYRPQHDYGYGNDHDHRFRIPFFPFHHHHEHGHDYDDYDQHYNPRQELTPSPTVREQDSSQCGILPRVTSEEVYPWIVRLAYLNISKYNLFYRI